jgi:hypothetical protein
MARVGDVDVSSGFRRGSVGQALYRPDRASVLGAEACDTPDRFPSTLEVQCVTLSAWSTAFLSFAGSSRRLSDVPTE